MHEQMNGRTLAYSTWECNFYTLHFCDTGLRIDSSTGMLQICRP
jgi:hypothetical protein